MPIYEYKCSTCGHTFEEFQRVGADGSELMCPECGTAKPVKLLSSFASNGADAGYAGGAPRGGNCSSGFG